MGDARKAWSAGDELPSRRASPLVHLRVEYCSDKEAKLLSLTVWVVTGLLLAGIVAGSVIKFTRPPHPTLFESHGWYVAHVVLSSVMLAALAALAAVFGANLWRHRNGTWKQRRLTLCRDAAIMLGVQMAAVSCWLAPYALVLSTDCPWFENGVAWLGFARWTLLNIQFLWMWCMVHGATRYRGSTAEYTPDSDHQLVMDAPWRQQARGHASKLVLWALVEAVIAGKAVVWLGNENDYHDDPTNCHLIKYECDLTAWQISLAVALMVTVMVYAGVYIFTLRHAFRDHAELPYVRYRLTNMYIRLMSRHAPVAFLTLFASVLLLQMIHSASCWSYIDTSMGAFSVQVAMCLLVGVQAALLMPKRPQSHDVLLAWFQEVAWTETAVPDAVRRRESKLRRAQFAMAPARFGRAFNQRQLLGKLQHDALDLLGLAVPEHHAEGKAQGAVPDGDGPPPPKQQRQQQQQLNVAAARPGSGSRLGSPQGQREQRAEHVEPIFCMEHAVRCFVWSQYAYRYWVPGGGMSHGFVMSLIKLEGFEAFHDPRTDTRALLAWRDGCILLAFRGTASKANVASDIKAWKVPLDPPCTYHGRPVKVHAGFLRAYTASAVRAPLRERIAALVAGFSPGAGLKLYLTGHSLGGALAVLAAHHLRGLHPSADLKLYTFGAPKVGNSAFAEELRAKVPDSFALVHDQDPIPRVPASAGFRNCGVRVLLDCRGDIVVRPGYFERRTMARSGGNPLHHKLPRYGLALASVLKAQFSPSKCLPGGRAGAEELAAALDLGCALRVQGLDTASLKDPSAPVALLVEAAPLKASQRGGLAPAAWASLCGGLCNDSDPAADRLLEEAEEGQAAALGPCEPEPGAGSAAAPAGGAAAGVQHDASGGGGAAAAAVTASPQVQANGDGLLQNRTRMAAT